MIHRDSQEGLTKICYENCDRIYKYGPSLIFFRLVFAFAYVVAFKSLTVLAYG